VAAEGQAGIGEGPVVEEDKHNTVVNAAIFSGCIFDVDNMAWVDRRLGAGQVFELVPLVDDHEFREVAKFSRSLVG
jgi:hypothetical protein